MASCALRVRVRMHPRRQDSGLRGEKKIPDFSGVSHFDACVLVCVSEAFALFQLQRHHMDYARGGEPERTRRRLEGGKCQYDVMSKAYRPPQGKRQFGSRPLPPGSWALCDAHN